MQYCAVFFFSPPIFLSYSVVLSPPVCVGCVVLGHLLSQLALWSCYWSGLIHPGGDIQDAVVSTVRSAIRSLIFVFFFAIRRHIRVLTVCVCVFFFFFAVVMVRLWFRLWIRISTRTRRCTVRYEKYIFVCIFVVTHHIRVFLFLIPPQVTSITGVKIVNYCSPLYFANAEIFRQRVIRKVQWQEWPLGVCVCVTYGCLYSYVFVSRPVWTRASLSWPGGSS